MKEKKSCAQESIFVPKVEKKKETIKFNREIYTSLNTFSPVSRSFQSTDT